VQVPKEDNCNQATWGGWNEPLPRKPPQTSGEELFAMQTISTNITGDAARVHICQSSKKTANHRWKELTDATARKHNKQLNISLDYEAGIPLGLSALSSHLI
jgi:hypothetical protein